MSTHTLIKRCMMNRAIPSLGILILFSFLQSCAISMLSTRTEEDDFTITKTDTTIRTVPTNTPGKRDNGVISPSTREVQINREVVAYDSTVKREYPSFIRLGLFESIGLIGTASSGNGIGAGIFGVQFDPKDFLSDKIGGRSSIFGGGFYRFGIAEYRLRWFRDAKNWTIGSSGFEIFYPEATNQRVLMSVAPLYLRKRWYFREDIPYICATFGAGLGFFPSQYLNLTGSIDVGSIGGLNIRAYTGLIAGMNLANTAMNRTREAVTVITPYAGFGISVLDFHNRVPELFTEWKDHDHSSWDIGLLRVTFMTTRFDSSALSSGSNPIKGYQIQVAPVSIALPIFNHRFYAGTELFNLFIGGSDGFVVQNRQRVANIGIGFGVLPIRVGYWQPVLNDELTAEPFISFSYFPTTMLQIGAKLNLSITERFNIGLNAGFISSGGFDTSSEFFRNNFGSGLGSFSTPYLGISFGILDRIFTESVLRYFKNKNGGK